MAKWFPRGDYFYIKSATSPSGTSSILSTKNLVIDIERDFFMGRSVVKGAAKVIISQQKSTIKHDGYQLWYYEDGFLVNKKTTLCLEVELMKTGSRLILHHRRSAGQSAKRKWVITKEGHISLKDTKFVLEVKDKNVILADISSKRFKNTLTSQFTILPLHPLIPISVVRLELICANALKNIDCNIGKCDPFVRVFHVNNNKEIIAQTKAVKNDDFNAVWNEVHYLTVKYIGEEFILDVIYTFKEDKSIGNCIFEITHKLVKEVSFGVYEGTPNGIDAWSELSIQGQIHYKAKFFPLQPFPRPTPDFLDNIKENPFDYSTFYILITLQAPNGERILMINPTIWITSMILWFLHLLLKEYRNEWCGIYKRAEKFIIKEINDLEIEETIFATGRKAICERFDIGEPDSKTKRISKETILITHVRRILKYQENTGAYPLTDNLAKFFGYENAEKFQITFNEYKKSHSRSQKISKINLNVWSTIMVLYFYRCIAIDHKKEWCPAYERSYKWLRTQLNCNESLEKGCFQIVKSFIQKDYDLKYDVLEMDCTFEEEIAMTIVSIKQSQKDQGIEVQKPYGIARIEIVCPTNLGQADSWLTDPYVRISDLATSWVYSDLRVIYNNCNPICEQVFYIPVYDIHKNFNLQIFNYNAFLKVTLLGFFIFDLEFKELPNGSYEVKKLKVDVNLTYEGSNRGKLSFFVDFFLLPKLEDLEIITTTNVTIRHLYPLMSYQNKYGCFELTDILARLFNFFSKKELIKTFSDFVQKDERVRSLDHKIWVTQWVDENQQRSVGVLETHIKPFPYDSLENFEIDGMILSNNNRKLFLMKYNKIMVLHKVAFSQIYSLGDFIKDIKKYQKVELHDNILKFIGIFKQSVDEVGYFSEYASDGTLHQYLNQNFCLINWEDRLHLAKQLVNAIKLLHENDIIHMNLNSENIFIHNGNVKVNVFECQNKKFKFPQYVDPQFLQNYKTYNLNRSSDIYSIGVLLWEISSCTILFELELPCNSSLLDAIIQGKRESVVFGTPKVYAAIYTKCWEHEQYLRPTIQDVYKALNNITYNDITEKFEVKYDMKHRPDILRYYVDWRNETTKELKLISSINATLKKTTLPTAETLKRIAENDQVKILNLSSLSALNITPLAPLKNTSIKCYYDEQKFLYNLNQLFITQFNIQGISKNTTCSIIYQLKRYINEHNKTLGDVFNQYFNNKHRHYFTSIIGFFYEYGIGTVINYSMAYDMYNQAAKDIYFMVTSNELNNSLLTGNLLKENQCIGLISLVVFGIC
ncbi:kinase-like protein [Gigaspora margarita]|uniref:Kinase-like protein n=1 Tax=Gigaspora margarita TaxID=4874 RepID=A0A8H4A3E4_GIGMA|nr:kinase-like protein [Gigaspora margarita]